MRLPASPLALLIVLALTPTVVSADSIGPIVPKERLVPVNELGLLRPGPGYSVTVFTDGLEGPRHLTRRGDEVWVANRKAEQIVVLRDANRDGAAEIKQVAIEGMPDVHGIEYHNGWFYIADIEQIYRFRDDDNDLKPDAEPDPFITGLPGRGRHTTRTLKAHPTEGKLYVSMGSSCDTCIEGEPKRASMWRWNFDGTGGEEVATGLRNAVGFDIAPSGKVYTTNHGQDNLGATLPPEGVWEVNKGDFMGWPYAYAQAGEIYPAKPFGQEFPDRVRMELPLWEYNGHAAPLGLEFWDGGEWGPEYDGDAYIAFHGSHLELTPSLTPGYNVVRLDFEDGRIVGDEVVLDGFLQPGSDTPIGRPCGLLQYGNAILITDDHSGRVYRLTRHQTRRQSNPTSGVQ